MEFSVVVLVAFVDAVLARFGKDQYVWTGEQVAEFARYRGTQRARFYALLGLFADWIGEDGARRQAYVEATATRFAALVAAIDGDSITAGRWEMLYEIGGCLILRAAAVDLGVDVSSVTVGIMERMLSRRRALVAC